MRRHLLPLVLGLASLPSAAQLMPPTGTDLFGDDIVVELRDTHFVTPIDTTALSEYAHALLFHDGRQLRGRLTELTETEIVWTRPDIQPALRFARKDVRRIVFSPAPVLEPEVVPRMIVPKLGVKAPAKDEPKGPSNLPATVKLPGGDWVFGDARMEVDGDVTVEIAPKSTLTFPRSAVEWLYFAKQPAPAFGFNGEALGMEGWTFGNQAASSQVADGVFKLQNGWLGRDIAPPPRFEIDLEVPRGDEGVRLWLQPFRASPNSYSTGTIELSFGTKELTRMIFVNRFERERTPWPEEKTPATNKATRFRAFYDGPGERLIVMRNDTVVGEWKLRDEANAALGQPQPVRPLRGIAIDRSPTNAALTLTRVAIKPWDGVVPNPNRAPESRMVREGAPRAGKLESIGETEFVFGGEKVPREKGVFVDLAQSMPGLKSGDALVSFGARGEVAATGLVASEGRARGKTAAIADFDLSVDLIHAIVFPHRAAEPKDRVDVLVFRNGDSMEGELVSSNKADGTRWKAFNGQELTMKNENVAGIRRGGVQPGDGPEGATIELATGDRFRGALIGLDSENLRFHHAVFGARAVPRKLARTIYPDLKTPVLDAGSDPESWMGLGARAKAGMLNLGVRRATLAGRVFLDGFFLNPPSQSGSSISTSINRRIDDLKQYELRCTVTDGGKGEPSLSGNLSGNNGSPTLQISLGHGQFRVYSYNMGGVRGRPMQQEREVSLTDKLPAQRSRRELRMFVDVERGISDFMVDGVHLFRFGQTKTERAPGLGSQVNLYTYSSGGSVGILSDVCVLPWNGDIPRPGDSGIGIALKNGDVASGAIGNVEGGALQVGEGADAIGVPLDRVTAMHFGHEANSERPAARVRLVDGSVLNLADYRWAEDKMTGESIAFGKVELLAKSVMELILSPAPARFPQVVESKKLAKKKAGAEPPPQP